MTQFHLNSQPNHKVHSLGVKYCINPQCPARENPDDLGYCQGCGTTLLIGERFRLCSPLRPLHPPNERDVFEVVDEVDSWESAAGTHKVMKVLNSRKPKLIELVQREATVLRELEYPGLPRAENYFTFTPTGTTLELHCLVMEKIVGQTLAHWLLEHERISQDLALNWLEQVVHLLHQVHQAGYFHRDLNPQNLMLQPDGLIALIDFGGVREMSETYLLKVGSPENTTGLAQPTDVTALATAGYVSQEQLDGKAVPQSDFFALGRTFVHLMTGTHPTQLPKDLNTGKLIWRNTAPQIARPLADLMDWLMDPAPGRRPQSTRIILQYLSSRLPYRLKFYQVVRSRQFKVGVVALAVLMLVGGYHGGRSLLANYYFGQGLRADSEDRLQDATSSYQKALQLDPQNVETYNNLAAVCWQDKDFSCAINHYRRALQLKPDYWQAHYGLGSVLDDLGDYRLAEQSYQRAVQYNPTLAVDAINNLARLKNRQGEYKAAIGLAQSGLQKADDPITQAALYKNLGWAELKLQRYDQARADLLTAADLDPQRADTFCLLAQVQEAQKDWYNARRFWQNCLGYDSNLPEVKEWRERVLRQLFQK